MFILPKAITFDCYGTLIDWESAIQEFFAESLDSKGLGYIDPLTLQTEWEEIQFRWRRQTRYACPNWRRISHALRDAF